MKSTESQLARSVQHNCDISDARFARDYSMCVYLLRMQEHYRWKNALSLDEKIDSDALGNWVRSTEDYWDTIEETDFHPIVINNTEYDPFDADGINQSLSNTPLAYTAGVGRLGQPHFLLAQCLDNTSQPFPRIELGTELARDTITFPAMSRDGTIVVRRDGMKRMLWHMIAEWRLHPHAGPMSRLLAHFNIDAQQADDTLLEATVNALKPLLVHHEQGEIMAADCLGESYQSMVIALQGRQSEGYARAVRDILADTLSTWPYIVEHKAEPQLDFWLAGLAGIRETLLENTDHYQQLTRTDNRLHCLASHIKSEQVRWLQVAEGLMAAFQRDGVRVDAQLIIESTANLKGQTE